MKKSDKPAIILGSADELRQARSNQPRVSLDYLRKQRARHQRAAEDFAKAAKNAISKPGPAKVAAG